MNANEREWESLSTLWRTQSQEIDRGPLQKMIASYRRRLAAVVTSEVLIVAGFVWLSWLLIRDGVVAWEAVWISTLWIFTAIAAPFAWWNRRGSWNAIAETVAEFRRHRAAMRQRSLRFACWLFVAEALVVAAELVWFDRFTMFAAATLAGLGLALGIWALWMRGRVAAELAALDADV